MMTISIQKTIADRPWLWIVLLFVLLTALWAWFITFAVMHQPVVIEVPVAGSPA